MRQKLWNWVWPASQGRGRMLSLDVLRGVAILMVLCAHVSPVWFPPPGTWTYSALNWVRDQGPRGVDLFFVLSGFLVGGLLVREAKQYGQVDWKRFLIRRGFKIWPAYYVYLLFLPVAILVQHGHLFPYIDDLRANFVHLQNYWRASAEVLPGRGNFITPRPHTWSLAVEEHFYLGLTLLIVLLTRPWAVRRGALRLIPPLGLALGLFCLAARTQFWNLHPGASGNYWRYPTHFRMDALFFGVVLAYFYHFHKQRFLAAFRWWPATLAAGVALQFLFPAPPPGLETPYTWTYGPTITYLGFALVLGSLVTSGETSPFMLRLLRRGVFRAVAFIGFFSYSIYLWHWDLGLGATKLITRLAGDLGAQGAGHSLLFTVPAVALYASFAIGMGIVLGRLIETPALALRDKLLPRRTAAMEDSAGGSIEGSPPERPEAEPHPAEPEHASRPAAEPALD